MHRILWNSPLSSHFKNEFFQTLMLRFLLVKVKVFLWDLVRPYQLVADKALVPEWVANCNWGCTIFYKTSVIRILKRCNTLKNRNKILSWYFFLDILILKMYINPTSRFVWGYKTYPLNKEKEIYAVTVFQFVFGGHRETGGD